MGKSTKDMLFITHGDGSFLFRRRFKVPRTLLWEVWTKPEHLKHWWGPKGMEITHVDVQLKPGGHFHYNMVAPGHEMWGLFRYREIVAPERLVLVSGFSDPKGNPAPVPFPGRPDEMLNTMTLVEEDGGTTLFNHVTAINCSDAQKAVFVENHRNMEGGYSGTMEKLDAYLATVSK